METFNKLYLGEKHALLKTKPAPKQHEPWMTHDILEMIRCRNKLYKKFRISKTDESSMAYKFQRNKCTIAVKTAKCGFLLNCVRSNSAKFWCQVKACTGLGKMKLSHTPWLCSIKAVSKASADAVNEHFVAAISSLVTKVSLHCVNYSAWV